MNHRRIVLVTTAGILAALVMTVQCHKPLPPGILAQEEIRADKGGRVETSDGKLVLEIPANALSGNTTVTISETQDSLPPVFRDFVKPLSKSYSIEIGNATVKDSLTLSITCDSMPSVAKSLCYYDDSLSGWVLTGAQVDSVNGVLSVKTGHLSDWWTVFIREPPISRKRLAVPYYEQYDNTWCMLTSMTMMMKNQGLDYEVHEVARDFGFGPDEGTAFYDYLWRIGQVYKSALGYEPSRVAFLGGANALLKPVVGNLIALDKACVNGSWLMSHAVVATGWSSDSVYINDPGDSYGFGRLGCASWDQYLSKVGYLINVLDVFIEPSAPASMQAGTLQSGSLWFGASLGLTYDGRYPRGYYYRDWGGGFPQDPNEDGYDLRYMPRTSDDVSKLSCIIANPTSESQDYRLLALLYSRSTGEFVSALADTSITVDACERRILDLSREYNERLLNQHPPGHYAFRFYLESDGTLLDTFDLCFNLAGGVQGTRKWAFRTGDYVESSPAIGSDGTIYVGSECGLLYAVNPDGRQKWCFPTSQSVYSSPSIGSDGTIYGSGLPPICWTLS